MEAENGTLTNQFLSTPNLHSAATTTTTTTTSASEPTFPSSASPLFQHSNTMYSMPTAGEDLGCEGMMTDVFNPNQQVYQSEGPFKKKSQAELNLRLLELAQDMRESEEQAKEATKKQRRMSWGGRKKESGVLMSKNEETKKEKKANNNNNNNKEKRKSRRFTLSFPSIGKRKSTVISPRKLQKGEGVSLGSSTAPKSPVIDRDTKEKEKEKETEKETEKENEEGGEEGAVQEETDQDIHADKEEVYEDKDGQVMTLR